LSPEGKSVNSRVTAPEIELNLYVSTQDPFSGHSGLAPIDDDWLVSIQVVDRLATPSAELHVLSRFLVTIWRNEVGAIYRHWPPSPYPLSPPRAPRGGRKYYWNAMLPLPPRRGIGRILLKCNAPSPPPRGGEGRVRGHFNRLNSFDFWRHSVWHPSCSY
jgi:hypothetical protein